MWEWNPLDWGKMLCKPTVPTGCTSHVMGLATTCRCLCINLIRNWWPEKSSFSQLIGVLEPPDSPSGYASEQQVCSKVRASLKTCNTVSCLSLGHYQRHSVYCYQGTALTWGWGSTVVDGVCVEEYRGIRRQCRVTSPVGPRCHSCCWTCNVLHPLLLPVWRGLLTVCGSAGLFIVYGVLVCLLHATEVVCCCIWQCWLVYLALMWQNNMLWTFFLVLQSAIHKGCFSWVQC